MLNRKRRCAAKNKHGEPCGFQPMRDNDLCWHHDPENEEAAQDARRLGGVRRKRESTLAGAYEFEGILVDGGLARFIDIAAWDALSLDSGQSKVRAMVAVAQVAEKILVARDHEERIAALESVSGDKLKAARR
jgi:hypothetical protein